MPEIEPCLRCDSELEFNDLDGYYLCNNCGYCIDDDSDSIKFHNSIYARIRKEVQRAEQLIGDRDHPENYCHRCGGKNLLNWTADNDVWNAVMRKDGSDLFDGIVCPICFVQLAEETYGRLWRLVLEGDDPEIDKLRVQLHESINKEADLLQRLSQLEKFAELAKPIVEMAQAMIQVESPINRKAKKINMELYDECDTCLAALPERDITLMGVYVDEAINPDDGQAAEFREKGDDDEIK